MTFDKEQRKLKSFAPPLLPLLRVIEKNEILFSFPKKGTFPLSLFLFNARISRFEALDVETGIDPVSLIFPYLVE